MRYHSTDLVINARPCKICMLEQISKRRAVVEILKTKGELFLVVLALGAAQRPKWVTMIRTTRGLRSWRYSGT